MTTSATRPPAEAPTADPPHRARRQRPSRRRGPTTPSPLRRTLVQLVLAVVVALSVFPLYWALVVASHDNSVVGDTTPPLVPGGHLLENLGRVFDSAPFGQAMVNSLLVSTSVAVANVFFSALAGFAFAKLRFRGRTPLMLGVVATMMVPTQLGIIPLYVLMTKLGWTGQLQALIVPAMVSAFGVFWMRQAIEESVPSELVEAAMVDGASLVRTFWHIVLPAVRPAAAVLGLFVFMATWNDFFWPLVVLNPENPTVQIALSTLASGYYTDYALMFSGTTLAVLPVLGIFLLLARHIVGGIMQGAVKG